MTTNTKPETQTRETKEILKYNLNSRFKEETLCEKITRTSADDVVRFNQGF